MSKLCNVEGHLIWKKKDNFLLADENSLEVLGIKNKKKDYVLAFALEGIASKILTNVQEVECSYTQFCCNVPKETIEPKPEDWGTWLCMSCLNPEMKLEAIKRRLGGTHNLTIKSLKQFKEDIKDLSHQIETSDTAFEYLEWSKEKRQNVWVISPWRMSVSALGNI